MFENLGAVTPFSIPAARKEALTLGQLANANAMSDINLELQRNQLAMMKDPQTAKLLAAAFAGGEGTGGMDASVLADMLVKYGPAAMNVMKSNVDTAKDLATLRKTNADTDKSRTEARAQQLQVLSNAADGFATQQGPLDPAKVVTFLRQGQYLGAAPLMSDIVAAAQSGDEGAMRAAFRNFSQAGATMAQRATAHKENVSTNLAPQQFNLDVFKTQLDAFAKQYGAEIKQDVNGNLTIIRPNAGVQYPQAPGPAGPEGMPVQNPAASTPGGQAPAGGQPVLNGTYSVATTGVPYTEQEQAAIAADAQKSGLRPSGAPQAISAPPSPAAQPQTPSVVTPTGVQTALAPGQAGMDKVRTETLGESRKAAVAANEALMILPQLRDTIRQGYTGTFAGSPVGKQLINLAITIGALKPEQVKEFENTRMSDTLVTKLLGPMAHSLSQRGMTNQSQRLIEMSKPGTENSREVADAMITALMTDARNSVKYDKELNQYVGGNPNDYGLTGWKPPQPDLVPQGKAMQQLPPPSVANIGRKVKDIDSGAIYINRTGKAWELVK